MTSFDTQWIFAAVIIAFVVPNCCSVSSAEGLPQLQSQQDGGSAKPHSGYSPPTPDMRRRGTKLTYPRTLRPTQDKQGYHGTGVTRPGAVGGTVFFPTGQGPSTPHGGCITDQHGGCAGHSSAAIGTTERPQPTGNLNQLATAFTAQPSTAFPAVPSTTPKGSQEYTIPCPPSEHMDFDTSWARKHLGDKINHVTSLKVTNCNRLHLKANTFKGISSLRTLEIANIANLTLEHSAFNFDRNNDLAGRSGILNINPEAYVDVGSDCVTLTFKNVTFRAGSPFLLNAQNCLRSITITGSDLGSLTREAVSLVKTDRFRIERSFIRGGIASGAFSGVKVNFFDITDTEFGPVEEGAFSEDAFSVVDTVSIQSSKFSKVLATGAFNFGSPRSLHFRQNVVNVDTLGRAFIRMGINETGKIENNYFSIFERQAFLGIQPSSGDASLILKGNILELADLDEVDDKGGEMMGFSELWSSRPDVSGTRLALKCSCRMYSTFWKSRAKDIRCTSAPAGDGLKLAESLTKPTPQEVNLEDFARDEHCKGKKEATIPTVVTLGAGAIAFLILVIIGGACFFRRRQPKRSQGRASLDASGTDKSSWCFERMGRDFTCTMASNATCTSRLVERSNSNNYGNGGSRRPSAGPPTIIYAIPETRVYQMSTAVENFEMAEDIEDPVIIQPIINEAMNSGGTSINGTPKDTGDNLMNTYQKSQARRKSRAESDVFRLPTFAKGSAANTRRQSFGVNMLRKHQTLDF